MHISVVLFVEPKPQWFTQRRGDIPAHTVSREAAVGRPSPRRAFTAQEGSLTVIVGGAPDHHALQRRLEVVTQTEGRLKAAVPVAFVTTPVMRQPARCADRTLHPGHPYDGYPSKKATEEEAKGHPADVEKKQGGQTGRAEGYQSEPPGSNPCCR